LYRNNKIALVIPAYREEKLIGPTLDKVPTYYDHVYVVDDCSPDNQCEVVLSRTETDTRISLLRHEKNQGPGGAIITGYLRAVEDGNDIVVVCGGDSQMPLEESPNLLDPIVEGKADYAKGNRFQLSKLEETCAAMPLNRLIGNWIISALTKIASGYYKTMDVVDGFTAISRKAIETVNWQRAWTRYGYPMDFLVRLNAYGFKIVDVARTAIYLPNERQSQIKGLNYALTVSPMLFRSFLWRLRFKYLYMSFHPLIFLFIYGMVALPAGVLFGLFLVYSQFVTRTGVTGPEAVLCALLIITGFQCLVTAMILDMQDGN
jgi:glycosyltransferase involved in cell wall biosynthesis